jgi:hypothetical protein
MAEKISQKVYGLMTGIQQDATILLLKDIATIDCYNVHHDKIGNICKAAGTSKLYEQQMKEGYPVKNIAILTHSTPIERKLIGFIAGEINFYNLGTESFEILKVGFSAQGIWRTALYNNVLFCVNAYDTPQKAYWRRQFELDRFGIDTTKVLYLMQDGAGLKVTNDAKNPAYDITLSSANIWSQAQTLFSNHSLHFDAGVSGYYGLITHGTSISTNGKDKWNIKGWIWVNSDGQSDLGRIVSKASGYEIYTLDESENQCKLVVVLYDSGGAKTRTLTNRDITLKAWNYFCIVYDGSEDAQADRVKIYVNGDLKASTGDDINATLVDGSNDLYIGDNEANDKGSDCYIDSLEII